MKNELNTNNSKELIIGISILFSTVILIIGGTFAFFVQGDSKELGNIVSSNDINTYINFMEESMMLDNLIPLKTEDLNKATIENEGEMCIDANGQHVCSAYMFAIENTYGEYQSVNISMIPTANSFTNLKFVMYKFTVGSEFPELITEEPISLEKNNLNPISLIENMPLLTGEENMVGFYIFFYIESMDYDQTEEDAGKHFGASIKVDSITTGKYITKSFGDSCWDLELIEGTIDEYKLTKFHGINQDGSLKEECEYIYVTKNEKEYYNVTVPSSVGGHKITTLGNELFSARKNQPNTTEELILNDNYRYIENVIVEEGIETIEDGEIINVESGGTKYSFNSGIFAWQGCDKFDNGIALLENYNFSINLPNSLKYIGDYGFTGIMDDFSIFIPKNVEYIGKNSFSSCNSIVFEGVDDYTSKLKYINNEAFYGSNITEITIPASVISIGEKAFYWSKLIKVTFKTKDDGTSELRNIGSHAFYSSKLDYQDENNPLVIPLTVTYIGNYAFWDNSSLKFIKYTGPNLSNFGNNWEGNYNEKVITE